MVTEEWQDYGTLRFCLNGNLYLSIFQSKARLKNFRMNIMMQLPDVMYKNIKAESFSGDYYEEKDNLIWRLFV